MLSSKGTPKSDGTVNSFHNSDTSLRDSRFLVTKKKRKKRERRCIGRRGEEKQKREGTESISVGLMFYNILCFNILNPRRHTYLSLDKYSV